MSMEFGFIGWCKEDNHDKIWGYFLRPTPNAQVWINKQYGWNCCVFWARRGKAMQFKADTTGHELNKLVSSKLKKGYREITPEKLREIWPSFDSESEGKLLMEVLSGRVK